MASPFVKKEFHTFEYPDPFDPDDHTGEDMGFTSEAQKINPEELDKGHWVKFRIPNSRRDTDRIAELTASRLISDGDVGVKFEQRIARANREVFLLFVEDWSFTEEFKVKPNADGYDTMGTWAGDWILACLGRITEMGTTRSWAEKNEDSSTTPEPSPNGSPSPQAIPAEQSA